MVKEKLTENFNRVKETSSDIFNSVKAKISDISNKPSGASRPKARNISKSLEFSTGKSSDSTIKQRNITGLNNFSKENKPLRSSNSQNSTSNNLNIKLSGRKKIMFYVGALVFVPLLVLAIGFYTFLSFSSLYTINISYEFRNVSASKEIVASTSATSDFQITKLEETDSISAFQNTSGQKIIGEKAKGKITVFNATPDIKVLKKGTSITCVSASCNGLVFTSVNDLNLGPGNSVNDYEIIASDIGQNYNLAVNAGRFKVANFNSTTEIVASNIEAISGGTPKQTVKIISAEDIKAVEEKALSDLKTVLVSKIKANPTNSNYIISDASFTIEKVSAETDKEGTEAEVINTTVKAKGKVDGFPKEKIQKVLDEIKNTLAPEGYYLDEKFFNTNTEVISSSPGSISLKVSAGGIARPNIDFDDLKKKLSGKSMSDAEKILSEVPNTKSFKAEYTPSTMPGFLRRVPSDLERIQISLTALSPE